METGALVWVSLYVIVVWLFNKQKQRTDEVNGQPTIPDAKQVRINSTVIDQVAEQ